MTLRNPMAQRLMPYGPSIFASIGQKALASGAVNLGQGFPDFDCPPFLVDAASEALRSGNNQYAPPHGVEALRQALADHYRQRYGLVYDPAGEITVQVGSTEGLFSTLAAVVNPGDEWIVLEPAYDTYVPVIQIFGGKAIPVALRAGSFTLDQAELAAAFGPRTRGIIVNSPHNPTGRVFTRGELETIARLCRQCDCLAVTDEVYEHLIFEGEHVPLASLPGMWERVVTISSFAKTFSVTGWKVGYCLAPRPISEAIRRVHQFVAFAVATPLQVAAARALLRWRDLVPELLRDLGEKRAFMMEELQKLDLAPVAPQGTFFVLADLAAWGKRDQEMVLEWIEGPASVACIPVSVFYSQPEHRQDRYVRFCFAKRWETLRAGMAGLRRAAEQNAGRRAW